MFRLELTKIGDPEPHTRTTYDTPQGLCRALAAHGIPARNWRDMEYQQLGVHYAWREVFVCGGCEKEFATPLHVLCNACHATEEALTYAANADVVREWAEAGHRVPADWKAYSPEMLKVLARRIMTQMRAIDDLAHALPIR